MPVWPPIGCGSTSCVYARDNGDKTFTFYSTLGDDKGAVVYTAAEVATFLAHVKSGDWDPLLAKAEEQAADELTTA